MKRTPFPEIYINLFVIGLISSSYQFLFIREVMNISGGYELITGSFLGSWLIGSAIGVALAAKLSLNDTRIINFSFSISPLISLFLLIFLSRLFLFDGETPSFFVSILYTFFVVLPFCIVSGFTFIKLITIAGTENNFVPGKSFSIETIGGIIAGLLITFLTAGLLNTYQLFLLVFLFSMTYTILTYHINNLIISFFIKILITLLASAIIVFNPDVFFRQMLLPAIMVTSSEDTSYGNITEGKYEGENSIYYNQRLLAYNNNVIEREENIHYAMLQHDFPEKVIMISGTLSSHLPEILKYPVKKIIYIERDPSLAEPAQMYTDTIPVEIIVANTDAYTYIKSSDELVDAILLLIPPPSTLQQNRYYTSEFFHEVKRILGPGGIFACSPGPGDTYLNKESINLYSSIYNSLASVFKTIKPVIGNKLYFIASDKEISTSFCQLIKAKDISNTYVNPDYLADDLVTIKSKEVESLIDHEIKQNRNDFPVACFFLQSYKFSKNVNEKIPAIVLMVVVFALPVLAIRRKNMLMYFSASALAGFEIIMLLTIQLIIGNMYQLTALLIAGLMAGLALGAGVELKLLNSFSYKTKGIILLIYYICIGAIYSYILTVKPGLTAVILILLFVFFPAFFTGHIFRELSFKFDASSTYTADLAGSALGFIFIAGFTVPVFGIKVSIFLLSSLIFIGILFGTIRNKL